MIGGVPAASLCAMLSHKANCPVTRLPASASPARCTGQFCSMSKTRVVRPALIWCDVRTEKQCRDLTAQIGAEKLIQLTCNPALTNFTLTKCLWVSENEPENWSRVRSLMLPKDYVRFRLTGERATDVADASGTLLLDVANRRWSQRNAEAAEIDAVASAHVCTNRPMSADKSPMAGAAATGLKRRHSRRRWRGRSGGRRDGHGNRFPRSRERDHRNVGSCFGGNRSSGARS